MAHFGRIFAIYGWEELVLAPVKNIDPRTPIAGALNATQWFQLLTQSWVTAINALLSSLLATPLRVASGSGSVTGDILTYPVVADGVFQSSGMIEVLTRAAGSLSVTVSFTAPSGAAYVLTVPLADAGVVAASAAAVGAFPFAMTIEAKAGTSVLVQVASTGFVGTFNAYGSLVAVP